MVCGAKIVTPTLRPCRRIVLTLPPLPETSSTARCCGQVVVKNEFHLPYRAVIRVYFGTNSLKTIEATAAPKADGETTLHWKLYRNFALSHPLDEGPINKVGMSRWRAGN